MCCKNTEFRIHERKTIAVNECFVVDMCRMLGVPTWDEELLLLWSFSFALIENAFYFYFIFYFNSIYFVGWNVSREWKQIVSFVSLMWWHRVACNSAHLKFWWHTSRSGYIDGQQRFGFNHNISSTMCACVSHPSGSVYFIYFQHCACIEWVSLRYHYAQTWWWWWRWRWRWLLRFISYSSAQTNT